MEGLYRGKNIFRKWRGYTNCGNVGKDKTVKPGKKTIDTRIFRQNIALLGIERRKSRAGLRIIRTDETER